MFEANTKILLVDDVEILRKLTRKIFSELGLKRVTEAGDGEEAWGKIEDSLRTSEPYQLIVSDYNMPKMRGVDLLEKVRAVPTLAVVPFILISADSETQAKGFLANNHTVWVNKPFTRENLVAKLENMHRQTLTRKVA